MYYLKQNLNLAMKPEYISPTSAQRLHYMDDLNISIPDLVKPAWVKMRCSHRFFTQMSPMILVWAFLLTACGTSPVIEEEFISEPEPVSAPESVTEPALDGVPEPASADNDSPAEDETQRSPRIVLKPDYPSRYEVVKGDTLWGITARFLRDPWRWPEVWQKNPQVADPHFIYPGDVLTLSYVEGQPVIQIQREGAQGSSPGTGAQGTELPFGTEGIERTEALQPEIQIAEKVPERVKKLSPRQRIEPSERAIPTIRADAIRHFLTHSRVLDDFEYENAPYVLAPTDGHLFAGAGNRIYVRGLRAGEEGRGRYEIIRKGSAYRNPDGELLGHEAIHVGEGRIERLGDPVVVRLTDGVREVLRGDRLVPMLRDDISTHFLPRPPGDLLKGQIIALVEGASQTAQFQTVVLNLGRQEGIEQGHVLAIKQEVGMLHDDVTDEDVRLPAQVAGLVMVFRVFDRVSYAIIMNAERPIRRLDTVTNP